MRYLLAAQIRALVPFIKNLIYLTVSTRILLNLCRCVFFPLEYRVLFMSPRQNYRKRNIKTTTKSCMGREDSIMKPSIKSRCSLPIKLLQGENDMKRNILHLTYFTVPLCHPLTSLYGIFTYWSCPLGQFISPP